MTEPASTVSMWSTLVPVMVGGAIALVGGWLAPWLVERRKEATEKKKKRAEKFEEMVSAVYDYDHWLDKLKNIRAFGSEDKETATPIAKLQGIAAVYFPEFNKLVSELDTTGAVCQLWMSQAGKKRLEKNIEGMRDGYLEVYSPYLAKRNELLDVLKVFAGREFQ